MHTESTPLDKTQTWFLVERGSRGCGGEPRERRTVSSFGLSGSLIGVVTQLVEAPRSPTWAEASLCVLHIMAYAL